jgi:hypothetical protein
VCHWLRTGTESIGACNWPGKWQGGSTGCTLTEWECNKDNDTTEINNNLWLPLLHVLEHYVFIVVYGSSVVVVQARVFFVDLSDIKASKTIAIAKNCRPVAKM